MCEKLRALSDCVSVGLSIFSPPIYSFCSWGKIQICQDNTTAYCILHWYCSFETKQVQSIQKNSRQMLPYATKSLGVAISLFHTVLSFCTFVVTCDFICGSSSFYLGRVRNS